MSTSGRCALGAAIAVSPKPHGKRSFKSVIQQQNAPSVIADTFLEKSIGSKQKCSLLCKKVQPAATKLDWLFASRLGCFFGHFSTKVILKEGRPERQMKRAAE